MDQPGGLGVQLDGISQRCGFILQLGQKSLQAVHAFLEGFGLLHRVSLPCFLFQSVYRFHAAFGGGSGAAQRHGLAGTQCFDGAGRAVLLRQRVAAGQHRVRA